MSHTHVQIGAGLFGLGMVFDICEQAGFESVLLNRDNKRAHHPALRSSNKCKIVYDGDLSSSRTLDVSHYYYQNTADSRAARFIAEPSVALLTTAVTPDGLADVAPLIANGIEMRRANGAPSLWVMACENLRSNSQVLSKLIASHLSETTREYFRTHVFFSNTVVDRVCADIAEVSDCIQVSVESFCEWIIEPPSVDLDAARKLSRIGVVRFVRSHPELEAYETRKYWCLNGFHLVAAAYAYKHDQQIDLLSNALLERTILEEIQTVQEELGLAVRCYAERIGVASIFTEEQIRQYNDNLVLRFIRNRTERISRLLKHEDTIESSIHDLVKSIVEPQIREIADSIQVSQKTEGRLLRTKLKTVLLEKLAKNVRLLDMHQFLRRVTERIIEPQNEILSYRMRRGEACPRLDLDDALQTIITVMSRYTKRAHDRAVDTLSSSLKN